MRMIACWTCSIPLRRGKLCAECKTRIRLISLLQTDYREWQLEMWPLVRATRGIPQTAHLLGVSTLFLQNHIDAARVSRETS